MRKFKLLNVVYLLLQISLYAMFLITDLAGESAGFSIAVKFIVILLCFLYVMIPHSGSNQRDRLLLRLALLFTLISDFIILFLNAGMYKYGMITFLTAQQLHGIRISGLSSMYGAKKEPSLMDKFSLRLLAQAAIAGSLCLVLFLAGVGIDALTVIVSVYFISLLFNVIRSIRLALLLKGSMQAAILAAGFFLFLLCDINVGIFNLSDFMPVAGDGYRLLYSLASIFMWLFYAPSQVLISLSIHPLCKNTQN